MPVPKMFTPKELYDKLVPMLRDLKEKQDKGEMLCHYEQKSVSLNILLPVASSDFLIILQTELSAALWARLRMSDHKNDQDILDQHVTRVFDSPLRSPGNMSPSTNQFLRRKPHQESLVMASGSECVICVQDSFIILLNSQALNHLCELRDNCRIQIYVKLKILEA